MQNSIKCKIIHPDPMGTKDQKIHSGQFNTKVLLPFASCVRTLSIPYLNKIAEKTMLRTVIRITDGFFSFFDVCRFPAITPARRGKCCSLSSIRSTSADADSRDITYHALFEISVHQYYTFFPNFTSGSFRFSK